MMTNNINEGMASGCQQPRLRILRHAISRPGLAAIALFYEKLIRISPGLGTRVGYAASTMRGTMGRRSLKRLVGAVRTRTAMLKRVGFC